MVLFRAGLDVVFITLPQGLGLGVGDTELSVWTVGEPPPAA